MRLVEMKTKTEEQDRETRSYVALMAQALQVKWRTEIEKAVDKVKWGAIPVKPRNELQKWWRKQFYRARALDKRVGPRIEYD